MKRIVYRLLVAWPALISFAVVGCYQGSASNGVRGSAPATSAARATPAVDQAASNTDEADSTAATETVADLKLPEGTKAIVLAVPGMH